MQALSRVQLALVYQWVWSPARWKFSHTYDEPLRRLTVSFGPLVIVVTVQLEWTTLEDLQPPPPSLNARVRAYLERPCVCGAPRNEHVHQAGSLHVKHVTNASCPGFLDAVELELQGSLRPLIKLPAPGETPQ